MQYLGVHFSFSDPEGFIADLLASFLGEINFESFEESSEGLSAYVQEELFNQNELEELLRNFDYGVKISYNIEKIESKNWNEEWEKNFFEPIPVGDNCIIHSSFHTEVPTLEYNITIDPKMAFGTGHHETTFMMAEEILKNNFEGKNVLDMGCGTSVLAILASKKGASKLTAIDIDTWCVDNSLENIEKNQIKNINVFKGNAASLAGENFDVIFANINRNILLEDMEAYSRSLHKNGELYISGFYTEDIPILTEEARKNHLEKVYENERNNWAMIKFKKLI